MNNQKEQGIINNIINPKLKEDEKLIGFFFAQRNPSFITFLLLWIIALAFIKYFLIAITDKGIHVFRINSAYVLNEHSFYERKKVSSLFLGSGSMTAKFSFMTQNQTQYFKALTRKSNRDKHIDDNTKAFLKNKMK